MKNERLKENVLALFAFAEEVNSDLNIAAVKLDHEIKVGNRADMTREELSEADKFTKAHYFEIVEARKNGDFAELDELIEAWYKMYPALAPSEEADGK